MKRSYGRVAAAALTLVLAVGLGACSADPLAQQYLEGSNKGYIAADGFQTKEIPPADRGEPIVFTGVADSGATVSSEDYLGGVTVVNFWYAGCGPCRVEAPQLEEAHASFEGQDVAFLGLNLFDEAEVSLAFAETYGVTYPSALAASDPDLKLAFADATSISAVPTTLVLDQQGRVAARIIGILSSASILETMVKTVLKEES